MKTKLLFIAAIFGLLSCSGDDSDSSSEQESTGSPYQLIEGTWGYYGYKYNGGDNPHESYADTSCGYWHERKFTGFDGSARWMLTQELTEYCQNDGFLDRNKYKIVNDGGSLEVYDQFGDYVGSYSIRENTATDLHIQRGGYVHYYRKIQ